VCKDTELEIYDYLEQDASDSCIEASDSDTLEEDSDPCALEEQWDGHDDNTCISADISDGVDDPTPQQSGDTSGDSHVLAPRDDEPPMLVVTHLLSCQKPMIATSHEDISGIPDMMEEPCVRDAHHGHVDPQTQEERHGLEIVGLIHTYHHEEIESPLVENPLFEQVAETPGPTCSGEDIPFIDKEDRSTCLDTSVWDPGTIDSSRMSAQEDTTHTCYNMSQRELVVGDNVQSHTSSEIHEVSP
jgi:hypothetical protein